MKLFNTLSTVWSSDGEKVKNYDHTMFAACINASSRHEAQSIFEEWTKTSEPTWKSDKTAKIKGALALTYFKNNGII
jgi:hypothetical protein